MKIMQCILATILVAIAVRASATDREWANTGTDFNAGASWIGGTAPGTGDRGYFKTDMTVQPALSASKTMHSLFFAPAAGTAATAATSASGGYVLSGAPGTVLTLTTMNSNWNGVYLMEQCTTGTNVISVGLAFPDVSSVSYRYINMVSGMMEISGAISGNSNNVLKVGGGVSASGFILSGDNTSFTGGFSKGTPFPIYIRNSKAVSKLTRLEFTLHGSGGVGTAASRFVNQTGAPLVFENNPNLFLSGGDGVIFEGDSTIDFGTGTVSFNDTIAGRNCPLTINAPLVKIGGPAVQTSSNNGYLKKGYGTLEVSGPSSYLGETTIGEGVFLAKHPSAVSPLSAVVISKLGTTGGILGLGYGDFTRAVGTTAGCMYSRNGGGYYSTGGWAAYGANRNVNIGNDYRAVTNIYPFLTDIILGSSGSDSTVIFQNPLRTQNSSWYSYDGAADVDGRFAGVITNYSTATPTISKYGNGTLDLSANNPLTGYLNIYEGRLLVSGSLKTSTTVRNGGTLGGSGILYESVTVNSNGTFSVKNQIGTTTLKKYLIFENGANLSVYLDGSNRTGIDFSGVSSRFWNYGTVNCFIYASNPEVAIGSMKIVDWTGATSPDVSGLDPTKFSIVNSEEFTGYFAKEGTALVLHYRSLLIKPTVIMVR